MDGLEADRGGGQHDDGNDSSDRGDLEAAADALAEPEQPRRERQERTGEQLVRASVGAVVGPVEIGAGDVQRGDDRHQRAERDHAAYHRNTMGGHLARRREQATQ